MIDNLKRIREPLTWAVIAIIAASILVGMVRLVLLLQGGQEPVFAVFQDIGASLMNISLVVAVVALVCTCFFISPSTPRALLVTRVAAWVLSVGVLLTLVCASLGVAASANVVGVVFEVIGAVLDLLLKALAAGALWVLMRGVHAGRIDTAEAIEPARPEPEPAPELEQPATVWQRDEAAGTAWRTADEAASGAPGSSRVEDGRGVGAIFRDELDSDTPGQPRP